MLNSLKNLTLVAALAIGSGTLAHARDGRHNPPPPPPPPSSCGPQGTNVAPEIDPGVAFGGLSLLSGGIAVMRSRRRQK